MHTKPLTSRERFARMYAHQEADRVPIIDGPWEATIERWQREGMPAGVSYVDYFDLDRVSSISVDTSPRYPVQTSSRPTPTACTPRPGARP